MGQDYQNFEYFVPINGNEQLDQFQDEWHRDLFYCICK